nr:DNRLRE domain-containing protein [Chloroflexota bacterium]
MRILKLLVLVFVVFALNLGNLRMEVTPVAEHESLPVQRTDSKSWLQVRETATPTDTVIRPTRTPTPTDTVIRPTRTPTPTDTFVGPTHTFTPVGPDVKPPTPTDTTVLPTRTRTPTPTFTPVGPDTGPTWTATPTNTTVVPTPTHTRPVEFIPRTFSGVVYLGEPGNRAHPLPDITVHLLKAPIYCDIGTLVTTVRTDGLGRFVLESAIPSSDEELYLNLALGNEDIHVAGANSQSGGRLTSEGWLQFEQVGSGVYDSNEFFVTSLVGQRLLTFPAVADAHISQGSPSSNYGNSSMLHTSYTAGATPLSEQALLFFDLSAIPWNTEVLKATLHVYLQEAGGDAKVCMAVHAIQEEWCEGPLCWILPPVTWNKQPGHALVASADQVVGLEPGYRVWDATALVQEWVSHPAWNYGMALLGEEKGAGWTRIFSSREGSNPPYLTVYVPLGTHIVTPTPTKSPTPIALDLQVDAIEVTQSIQCKDNPNCPDNAVPMVAGKMTFARVYIKVSGSMQDVPNVSARAIAKVGGQQLTAWPINPTITAKLTPDRAQFNDTLNFYLHGVSSSGTLEVEVNPFGTIPESNYNNNKKTVNLNFVTTPPLRIVPIWIWYAEGGKNEIVDWTMPGNLQGYLKKVLPVGDIQWYLPPNPVLNWSQAIGPEQASWSELLAKINDLRNKNPSMPSDAHWYGMIPFKVAQGSISGLAYMAGHAAIGRVPVQHENLEDGADILVHELGHNFNRGHAPCGLPDGEVAAPYPYANAIIADYGWDWNFAGGDKVPSYPDGYVVPKTSYDLMSYCQDEWVSEYTYRAILSYRGSTAAASKAEDDRASVQMRDSHGSNADLRPYLFASGFIGAGEASLDPWSILERPAGSHDGPGTGPYQLHLLAENGSTLFERRFNVQATTHTLLPGATAPGTQNSSLPFYEILPWYPDTARIQIRQGEQLLAERIVSAHPPTVELTLPQGGELWVPDGQYHIEWQASDPDSSVLWFDVAFSRDNGETWEVVATRLQEPELLVRGDQFPGTETARVRVYASDGVRTSSATSEPFAVQRKPPQVFIAVPENGLVVPPGTSLMLSGLVFDREDSPLADLLMHWYSDRDGPLGSGDEIMVQSLSSGKHVITLTAVDSDSMESSAQVTVFIGYQLHLPVLLKIFPPPPTGFTDHFEDGTLTGWTPNLGLWTNSGYRMRGEYTLGNAWNIRNVSAIKTFSRSASERLTRVWPVNP